MKSNMIRVEKSHYPVAARSHAGMSGKNNEDRFAVTAFTLGKEKPTPVLLAVLADGIGGHRAGEVAAEIAVNRITQTVADSSGQNPVALLEEAIHRASQEIFVTAEGDSERKGMGATCAVALIIGSQLYAASVGDSRIYLLREGRIQQISNDHTWIQEALDLGLLDPEQAVGHPNAHVIRRFLGAPHPPEVDFRLRLSGRENDRQSLSNQGMHLRPGDQLVLCSDGLTDLVSNSEILDVCSQHPLEAAADTLVELANTRGGHDNITLITFQANGQAYSEEQPARKGSPVLGLTCLGLVLLALMVAGAVWGWNALRGSRQPTPTPGLIATPEASVQPEIFESDVTPQPLPTNPAPLDETTPPAGVTPEAGATLPNGGETVPGGGATLPNGGATLPSGGATLTPWPTNTAPAP